MNTDDENTLVIDELIDDFGEEELQDEELLEEERDLIDSDQNQKSPLEVIGDEDEEDVAIEDDLIVDQDTNLDNVKSQSKYGKLWEFIRDLLQNDRYNPSIIKWENIEEGEFRIVDSSMVAGLWAMVKGNTKMNYEKLSRAIRLVDITVSACLLTTMFESHSMSNLNLFSL